VSSEQLAIEPVSNEEGERIYLKPAKPLSIDKFFSLLPLVPKVLLRKTLFHYPHPLAVDSG
jgi:hypothetical protein